MKKLIRIIPVLLGYFFVVACPVSPAGAPSGGEGGVSRPLIGQPLAASGGDAGGGSAGGSVSGDVGGANGAGASGGGAGDGGGGGGASAPGSTSDAPIVITGNPMGIIPGPNCGYAYGTKVVIDGVQAAITGNKDDQGRDLIQVKGAAYTEASDGTRHNFQGEFISFLDVADAMNRIGSTSAWSGCFEATIHAPPSAAGKVIRLDKRIAICQGDSAEGYYDLTIPDKTAVSALAPCSGPTKVHLPDVSDFGDMERQSR